MKRKATPSRTRRSASRTTGPLRPVDRAQGPAKASTRLATETEMPLDAEDVALASLEARIRAMEAEAGAGPAESFVGLTVRLPRAVVRQLLARAAEHRVTPSKLVEVALAASLFPKKPGRRRT